MLQDMLDLIEDFNAEANGIGECQDVETDTLVWGDDLRHRVTFKRAGIGDWYISRMKERVKHSSVFLFADNKLGLIRIEWSCWQLGGAE
jgi:hypothetical protein